MSARVVIGWLTPEDHERYLHAHAAAEVARSGTPALAYADAVRLIAEDQMLFRSLREKYEIDAGDAVDFSLFDGAIMEAD